MSAITTNYKWKVAIGLFLFIFITAYIGKLLLDRRHQEMVYILDEVEVMLISRLQGHIDYLSLLSDMRGRGELAVLAFEQRTADYLQSHPELINFTWVDEAFYIRAVSPLKKNKQIIGLHLDLAEPARVSALAKKSKQPQYTTAFEAMQGGCSFELWFPVYNQDKFLGLFAAVYSCQNLLNITTAASVVQHYRISFSDLENSFLVETSGSQYTSTSSDRYEKELGINSNLLLRVERYQESATELKIIVLLSLVFLLVLVSGYFIVKVRREMLRSTELHRHLQQSNSSLSESKQRFRLIFDTSPVGMMLIDKKGKILDANQFVCDLFRYQKSDLLTCSIEALVPKDTRKKHQSLREGYQDKPSVRMMAQATSQLYGRTREGDKIPLEIALAPIYLDGSTHTLVSVIDNTERKLLIDELKAKNGKLNQSNELLGQSNEQLERFAYICSHDLQEPVRMVQSFGQLLEQNLGQRLSEKEQGYLSYMVDGANRARDMIDDILQYCRFDQPGLKYEQVSLTKVFQLVETSLIHNGVNEKAVLTWENDMPELKAVSSQIFQLFMNLVSNGLKFNRSEQPSVAVSAVREGEFWHIFIQDNGIGIAEEYQSQIFDIFERLHGNREFPGTGIGLASCKRILERHKAFITVRSKEGEGSTFIIRWPVDFEKLDS